MALDPQAKAVLDQMAAQNLPARNTVIPAISRTYLEKERAGLPDVGPEVANVEDRLIPGPGGDIWVRIYTPTKGGPFPVLALFHGGGWVRGSVEGTDGIARRQAVGAGCVVISVDYRLAPENKFPAAAEDCYTATAWVAQNAATINIDPDRIAVGGCSAGGNLAAVVALMARDRGGPPLVFQWLVYPVIERNYSYGSYKENEWVKTTTEELDWYWRHYLWEESEAENPYAAPIKAKDLSGLPPALVITAELDPLRDEGEAYAQRLKQAGVPTTYTCYEGVAHGFFRLPGRIDKGKEATAQVCEALKTSFAG